MPPPRVKDFIKDFDLGEVFIIRSRHPMKNRRAQRSSIATHHEGDRSIPADIPSTFPFPSPILHSNLPLQVYPGSLTREPDPEVPANVFSAISSWGQSSARKASDMAQLALPLVQAVAGAIPLVGAPMQAAIGGLLTGLQAIDRHGQNKADLKSLNLRLDRLSRDLCNAPPAMDPLEQSRRDTFVSMLHSTSARVSSLHERCLASTPATQAIAGCFTEIDRYLAEYLFLSQMQSQDDMRAVLAILQRQEEFLMRIETLIIRGQSSVGPAISLGCVTLVDATGHEHPIPVNFCTSYQQLNDMLQVLLKRDSIEAQVQRRYMEKGEYDLCIDDDKQVTRLTSHGWPMIGEGTKIVMRVVIEQQKTSEVNYHCHFCGAVNHLRFESIMYWFEPRAGASIDCRVCKRRFQITRGHYSAKLSTRSSKIDSNHTTDAEMHLIRNFHVQQTACARSRLLSR
ncbi:hypothetical protein EDB19DRAFT_2030819, partial [Suillus lakei]